MRRSQVLLAILAALLVVALFYVLLFQPKREEVAELEAQIAEEQTRQAQIQTEIDRLELVRDEAPEVEAELAAAEAIVPRDASLPAALRQLQLAADESGLVLQSVTTGRPAALETEAEEAPTELPPTELSGIDVNLQLTGSYFQVVDFLRRVEDPTITPRGLTWNNATVARDEYPTLSVSLSGRIYAIIELPPAPEAEAEADPDADPDAEPDDTDQDEEADDSDDVDVDVDVES